MAHMGIGTTNHKGAAMRTLTVLATFAVVLALTPLVHAAEISSPAIFGSYDQDRAECVIYNGGTGNLSVTIKILTESGTTQAQRNCGTVPAGEFCAQSVGINFGVAYACTATAGTIATLRGALVIQQQVPDGFGGTYTFGIRSAPLR
jgi:hypothetical protein